MLALSWIFRNCPSRAVEHGLSANCRSLSSAFIATATAATTPRRPWASSPWRCSWPTALHIPTTLTVPAWVKLACHLAMAFGTAMGGWKIVKTMGHKIFKLEAVHGFCRRDRRPPRTFHGASLFGAPISTTHTISTSILGVGASKRLSAVRWGIAGNMVIAWILTIPAAADGGGLFLLLDSFGWQVADEKN